MPSFLPASPFSLAFWLLLACSAHAGPFEDCNLGEDFEFSPWWSADDQDRISKGCNDFIKQAPADPKKLAVAYTNRGNAHNWALEQEKAIADYTKAIEVDPLYADGYYRRANVYVLTDCPLLRIFGRKRCSRERAILDYDKAIEIDPRHRWAYCRRGYAHELDGNLRSAIADYTKHLEMNPKDAVHGYWLRARIYHGINDYDRAIVDYTKLIEIDKIVENGEVVGSKYDGYGARASVYFDKKDYDRAISDYTKIMETLDKRTMGHQHAHLWRLRAHAEKGDHDYAIAEFTKMINASPGYAVVYSERARAYFRSGRTSQALADAEKAMELVQSWLKRDPGAAFAFDVRGHVHETLGKRDEAIADYRKALKLNPTQAMWSGYRLRRLGTVP